MNSAEAVKIPISQIGYKSEWALAKFFDAYFNEDETRKKFDLKFICGRQKGKKGAINSLIDGLEGRLEILFSSPTWRATNRQKEVKSMVKIIKRLHNNGFTYSTTRKRTDGSHYLADEVYDASQAIIIQSSNLAHPDYIIDAAGHQKHILCEKPLVPVIENGEPTDRHIKKLEELVKQLPEDITLMDAEHYSYKKSSLVFYENLGEVLEGKKKKRLKIKKIVGEGIEIDDPYHWRTQDILNFEKSGSGLMGDTLCHQLAFISNLGGKAIAVEREYDMFESEEDKEKGNKKVKYEADTYDYVIYKVQNREVQNREVQNRKNKVKNSTSITPGNYFTKNCKAYFTVAKFIDKTNDGVRKEDPEKKESKFIKFTLEDGSEVTIDFIAGTTKRKFKNRKGVTEYYQRGISGNEYVNIMNYFYDSITSGKRAITDFRNSLETMKAIYSAYALPEEVNKKVEIYQ